MKRTCFLLLIAFLPLMCLQAQSSQHQPAIATVSSTATPGTFALFANGKAAGIYVDKREDSVVQIAATAFSKDIQLVTGTVPALYGAIAPLPAMRIIIGTLGKSEGIDRLASEGSFEADSIRGKWEAFCIKVIDVPGVKAGKALVIAGSDARGTAYGVFHVSSMIGVSPWYWWADVTPEPKNAIYVSQEASIIQKPSIKYRGVFLNDEDWGLQPWAAKHMDTTLHDIGPRTYEKVCELLLRLKANYMWPAMHYCTKAFFDYPENIAVTSKYAIVIGSSHSEVMLRNNLYEWVMNYKQEYGKDPGPWRYDINTREIAHYWEDRVKVAKNYPVMYTVGMRSIHDGSMPGPDNVTEKVKLLQKVITDQRLLLAK